MKLQFINQQKYMIVKFPSEQPIPASFHNIAVFKSITYTSDECSFVVPEDSIPSDNAIAIDKDWAVLQIIGILDFSLVGILAELINPLAKNDIAIFALSTFNTDYLLIKNKDKEKSQAILQQYGHQFIQ